MPSPALHETYLPERQPPHRGKVRDIYDLGDSLVIVATDRISAYDWVNPTPIPDKGKVLTQLSLFWFNQVADIIDNHLISADLAVFPEDFQRHADQFDGRSMLVRKCEMYPIEFVVRGYLAGSGWKEYQEQGTVCGIPLPGGLRESDKLETPIFTPATKATDGHDINITGEEAADIIGKETLDEAADVAVRVYERGRDIAGEKGIILCDTKFEFGVYNGQLLLADEVLTPDSSRFWPANEYQPGSSPPSFDKQYVRDWLSAAEWDRNSPPPPLPDDVVEKTREKYMEAFTRLTGKSNL
ncbi:MAG: phosphoribosylaminoimidazolesuccinocarboxamide synthase [Candidatus Hydrogenedentota bacterium]